MEACNKVKKSATKKRWAIAADNLAKLWAKAIAASFRKLGAIGPQICETILGLLGPTQQLISTPKSAESVEK
jgi:hypothetical protein